MNAHQALIVAELQAKTAMSLIEMEGMKAANLERDRKGQSLAYGEEAFIKLVTNLAIDVNLHIDRFRNAN